MVVCQPCTNIGPTAAALLAFSWGEPIGHQWIPLTKDQEYWLWCLPKQSVEQTIELSNRWFETPMWSTSIFTCLKMWLFCFEEVQTDPNTMYKRIMACLWSAPSHYLNQHWYILSIGPLQTNFSEKLIEIHIFAFKKINLKMSSGKMASILSGPQCVNMNHIFMLVYSRSVTMPGLNQNQSLLPALGQFRCKVVLANYGVKKKLEGNMCWADVGSISAMRCRPNFASTLDWCRPPTSAQHRFDVSHNTWIS